MSNNCACFEVNNDLDCVCKQHDDLLNKRKRPTNCPYCNSAKIGLGEYYYKYGPDSPFMGCDSCGQLIDCSTPEEIIQNEKASLRDYIASLESEIARLKAKTLNVLESFWQAKRDLEALN